MMPPRLIAAVPTPLDDALHVAGETLARACRHLLASGCEALVLFGTTGEGTFFSVREKLESIRRLVAAGVEPRRIILATGACALDDAAAMANGAREIGCAASLVLPPFFTKAIDDDGLAAWFDTLIEHAGGDASLLLYHIPAVAGVGFRPKLVLRLAERHPGAIRGVKDSSPDSQLAKTLIREGFAGVYVSTEVDLAANLASGIAGTISASLNVTLPRVKRALADAANADPAIAAIRAHLARHTLIWAVKAALHAETGDPAWARLTPPHRPPEGISQRQFLDQLHTLQAMSPT